MTSWNYTEWPRKLWSIVRDLARDAQTARRAFLVGAFAMFGHFALAEPMLAGDGVEYHVTLQAWWNHLTPDIRGADCSELGNLYVSSQIAPKSLGCAAATARANSGAVFTGHFWMYSLCALPAKLLLRILHLNELCAFPVTNAGLFLLALYVTIFKNQAATGHRGALLAALAGLSPVLWYLPWPSPEVYSWAAVVLALTLLANRRYAWGALAAAAGSLQNAPILILALYILVCALAERRLWTAGATAAAASLCFLPNVFYLVRFGTASLIASGGGVDTHLLSVHRSLSVLVDLNQGILPHAPGLIVLAAVATVRVAMRPTWRIAGYLVTAALVIASCGVAPNWNAGAASIQRYAIWIIPLLAWLIIEAPLPAGPVRSTLLIASLSGDVALALGGSSEMHYLDHNRLAKLVLDHVPWLYDPEPDIFAERENHGEFNYMEHLPMAHALPSGDVTKILVDGKNLEVLPQKFLIDVNYLEEVKRSYAGRSDIFYLNPPRGAVMSIDSAQ